MDSHVVWMRRHVGRTVLRRLATMALAVTVAAALVLGDPATAVLIGQAVALAWLGLALISNPLGYRYLAHHLGNPPWFEPGPPNGEPHAHAAELVRLGMRRTLVAGATDVDEPDAADEPDDGAFVYDILQSKDRLLTAAVNRGTGSVSVMSRLADGRIVHTTPVAVVPREQLVALTVSSDDLRDIVRGHVDLLGRLADQGIRPVDATPRLWLDAMALEHGGYEQLGPLLGSLLHIDGGRTLGRLLVPVPADDVLALSVPIDGMAPTRGVPTLAGLHVAGAVSPAG